MVSFTSFFAILSVFGATFAVDNLPVPRLECECLCPSSAGIGAVVTKSICKLPMEAAPGMVSLTNAGKCAFYGKILGTEDAQDGIMDGFAQHCPEQGGGCVDKCRTVIVDPTNREHGRQFKEFLDTPVADKWDI